MCGYLQGAALWYHQRHRLTYFMYKLQGQNTYGILRAHIEAHLAVFLSTLTPMSTVSDTLCRLQQLLDTHHAPFFRTYATITFDGAPLASIKSFDALKQDNPETQICILLTELLSEVKSLHSWTKALGLCAQEEGFREEALPQHPPGLRFAPEAQSSHPTLRVRLP